MNKYELIKYIKESTDNITDNEIADALCDGEYLDKLSREIDFDQETVEDAHDFLIYKEKGNNWCKRNHFNMNTFFYSGKS